MNPKAFSLFAAVFVLSAGLLAFARAPLLAAIYGGIALVSWLLFSLPYKRRLSKQKRSAREDDRLVDAQAAAIVLVVGASCLIALKAPARLWNFDELTVGVAAVTAGWLVAYVSCFVDWYYVLPRRDGVIREPPCRSSGDPAWTTVTRVWYLHRAIAAVLCALAAVVAAIAFGLAALSHLDWGNDPAKVASLLVAGAGAGLGVARIFYGGLGSVGDVFTSCCFGAPDIAIGDHLRGGQGFVNGFVREVALEGVTVVRLERNHQPLMGPCGVLTKRHGLQHVLDKPEIYSDLLCPCENGCRKVIKDCQWQEPDPAPGPGSAGTPSV